MDRNIRGTTCISDAVFIPRPPGDIHPILIHPSTLLINSTTGLHPLIVHIKIFFFLVSRQLLCYYQVYPDLLSLQNIHGSTYPIERCTLCMPCTHLLTICQRKLFPVLPNSIMDRHSLYFIVNRTFSDLEQWSYHFLFEKYVLDGPPFI